MLANEQGFPSPSKISDHANKGIIPRTFIKLLDYSCSNISLNLSTHTVIGLPNLLEPTSLNEQDQSKNATFRLVIVPLFQQKTTTNVTPLLLLLLTWLNEFIYSPKSCTRAIHSRLEGDSEEIWLRYDRAIL